VEIDFSKLPDKTEPKGIDLSGLPDKEINPSLVSTGPQWVQGKEPTLYEKVTNVFRDKPKEAARATLALVDSETLGINPGTAYSFKDALDKYYDIDPERKAKKQATLKAIQTFNDTGTEEGWGEAIWKNIQQVPLRIQAAGGRILQMLEETVSPETIQASLSGMSNDEAMEVFKRVARAREEKQVRSIGREFALEKEKQAADLMPNIMPGSFKDVVGSATQSTLNNIIYLAPGMAFGRAIPLMLMGGQAFGESYGEQREAGQTPERAAAASTVKMVSEMATEFIPTGKYLKPKLSFVQRLVEAEFAGIPGESVNSIVNDVVDKVTIRPDMTVQDAIENIQKTIQVTALSTLGLTTGSHSVNKAIVKSMPDGSMKQTVNEAVKDSLNRGATPQEALKAGIDAVKATPEGQKFVEKKMEKIINQAETVKKEIDRIKEEANIDNQDLDTDLDRVFSEEMNIDDLMVDEGEKTASTIDSDAVLEGETGVTLDEGEKAQEEEQAQPQRTIADNLSILTNEKGSIDLEPLVDIGRTIWNEGKRTYDEFVARIKEIVGDLWEKVKPYLKEAWDAISNKHGSIVIKKRPLYDAVIKSGGIDPDKIKSSYNWKDDIQSYGLVGVTRKGGRALDDLATELQSRGILEETPEQYAGPGDWLLARLKEEKRIKIKETIKTLTEEEKQAIKELEGEWRNEGLTEDEIKQRFNEVQKDTQKEVDGTEVAQIVDNLKDDLERQTLKKESPTRELKSTIPTSKVKSVIRRNTGQVSLADLVREDEALRAAFKKAEQAGRAAYRAGNQAGVDEQKQVIKKILNRRALVKNVRDYFGLSDYDLKKITRRNPLLMSDQEFHDFLKDVEEEAVYLTEKAQAKFELMLLIESRHLKKWDNYREALELPPVHEMTTEQLRQFAELLEPYQDDDTFLGKREIETVDKTDLAGIRTWREAREKLAQELNVPIEKLATVQVGALDSFRWDTALREQNVFYQLLVDDMTKAMMGADMQYHNVETKAYKLAKKSEKSRKRGLVDRAIPQDDKIMNFLESPDDIKEMLARDMTPEQLDYAHFMQEYFRNALDYLLATKALEKGRENYFVHARKSFLESVKDDGLIQAFKNMWKNYQEDEAIFKILDDDTGKILPLEKFFQFALHRTGYLDPTTNVTKAFLQYARTFERKKMFDAIIPKMDIYAQSLTPETYTERGLETDRTLKKFVYQYVNNKKGRRLSYDGALKQGGKIDIAIRGIRTFTSMLDLGLSPIVQTATFVGEQVATAAMLGPVNITKAMARIKTEKGKRILKKYEVFTGRSFWEEFTAPGKQLTERLTETMFAGFHASMKLANKQFLLGSLTEQEWNSEEISPERLAEMKLEMGRFRPVPGTQSLIGSTSVGNAAMQYKTWAVSITRSTIQDMTTLLSDLKNKGIGEALTTREAKELIRIAGLTSAVLIVGAMAEADSDDDSFIGKMKARAYREAMSLTQGMDPTFWLATPRLLTWLFKTAQALKQIVTLEEYKNKPGLKGVENLKKQVVPRTLRLIGKEEPQGGRR